MVEPVSLTLGAMVAALVAKAVDKAVDKTAEQTVEGGAGMLGRLVGWLRERLGAGEDPGRMALARVEDVPDSPSRVRELAEALDRRAAGDGQFRAGLEALVAEARAGGVDVGSIAQTVWGDQNVQNAAVTDSTVTVTYGQPPPAKGR